MDLEHYAHQIFTITNRNQHFFQTCIFMISIRYVDIDMYMHEAQIWLSMGYYHFVKPHSSLTIRSDDGINLIQRTPAIAAGVTDHIWSIKELLTFPNCYHG